MNNKTNYMNIYYTKVAPENKRINVNSIGLITLMILLTLITFSFHLSAKSISQNIEVKNNEGSNAFMLNKGQWSDDILFRGRSNGIVAQFLYNGISYAASRELEEEAEYNVLEEEESAHEFLVWNVEFTGANLNTMFLTSTQRKTKISFLTGRDTKKHVVDAPVFDVATYANIYNNIDLVYYKTSDRLKYDYIVRPDGNVEDIKMTFNGINDLFINESGSLEVTTAWGTLIDAPPYSYQFINGQKEEVEVVYQLADDFTISFKVIGNYNKDYNLVIDPVTLIWGTYFKATALNAWNYSLNIQQDNNGDIYITGQCDNTLPTTPGVYQTIHGASIDAFISKLSADGTTLLWSTYLGGNGQDIAYDIAINAANEVFVTGYTVSADFPISAGAYQPVYNGNDAFVTKLNAAGNTILYSTYLGGSMQERGEAIYINGANEAYIAGRTYSSDFPTTAGAFQTVFGGAVATIDGFVTKLNAAGTGLIYSTYVGGTGSEVAWDLTVNSLGEAYICGSTSSADFPVTAGAYQTANQGNYDVFVTKLNANGDGLIYSTFIGGASVEWCWAIDINAAGQAYVTGFTGGGFPVTAGAFQTVYGGGGDVFVARLNSTGNALIYATYLGGSLIEYSYGIAVNAADEVYVSGFTQSNNFPVSADAYQGATGGNRDFFISLLDPTGQTLICGTYLGGNDNDYYEPHIVLDQTGLNDVVVINGTSHSNNLPTQAGVYQPTKINGAAGDQPVVFKLESCSQSVLPIELLGFSAQPFNQQVKITWKTLSEVNNEHFIIERKGPDTDWQLLEVVLGAGNSTSPVSYQAYDDNPLVENYYRLKQVDFDGKFTYSKTISINIESNLKYGAYQIYDLYGRDLTKRETKLPTGIYIIKEGDHYRKQYLTQPE